MLLLDSFERCDKYFCITATVLCGGFMEAVSASDDLPFWLDALWGFLEILYSLLWWKISHAFANLDQIDLELPNN